MKNNEINMSDNFECVSKIEFRSKGKFKLINVDDMLVAKRHLYSLLLKKSELDLTDVECEIMYLLSKDNQIQEFLTNAK